MHMTEWIEVPKKRGDACAVRPDAVLFAVIRMANGGAYVKVTVGAQLAAKLKWEQGTKLRLRWSAGAPPKLRLDTAPPAHAHAYALKLSRNGKSLNITSSALPEHFAPVFFQAKRVEHEAIVDAP